MHHKLRILLPVAQVVLAGVVLVSDAIGNASRPPSFANMSWTRPAWQICLALNAPATVVAAYPLTLAYQSPSIYPLLLPLQLFIRLSLSWLLWYLVAVEIEGNGRSVLTAKTRIQGIADLSAIAFGISVAAAGVDWTRLFTPEYARLVATPYLIWAVTIVGFYSRDLWLSSHDRVRFAGHHSPLGPS